MWPYERRVVTAMITTDDPDIRADVVTFAGRSLGAMPEFMRFGITAITVGLTGWDRVRRLAGVGRSDIQTLSWLERHPVGLVRQWTRALRSLVLFAEQEQLDAVAGQA